MTKNYKTIWLDKVDSTNDEANRNLSTAGNISVIAAKYQTAGRGQRGNVWKSAAGDNLTFTVTLKFGNVDFPSIEASRQFIVSQVASLSVLRFLSEYGVKASIKWPNDIYVGDNKICGILIEHHVAGGTLKSSIIGIGINLNQTVFPPEIPNPTSVRLECGKKVEPVRALECFMRCFVETAGDFSDEAMLSAEKSYIENMYRKDIESEFIRSCDGEHFRGIIRGVSEDARLVMEMSDGSFQKFAFKEISLSLLSRGLGQQP